MKNSLVKEYMKELNKYFPANIHLEDFRLLKSMMEIIEEKNEWRMIAEVKWNRKYAKKYLQEQREKWNKENPERALKGDGLLYPDSDEIFKDYYLLRNRIDRVKDFINKMLVINKGTKNIPIPDEAKDYIKMENEELEFILNTLDGEYNESI